MRSTVLRLRLSDDQATRLEHRARQLGRSASETGVMLIEEGLRQSGSTLAVWEVVWIARPYKNSVEKTSAHLEMSPLKVKAALNYAEAFPEEIETAIKELEACDFESIRRILPHVQLLRPNINIPSSPTDSATRPEKP